MLSCYPPATVVCSVHMVASRITYGRLDEPDEEVCPCLHMRDESEGAEADLR
jgi:hypothetical protein